MKKLFILLVIYSIPQLTLAQDTIQYEALKPFANLLGTWSLEGKNANGKILQEFEFNLGLEGHIIVYETKIELKTDSIGKLTPFIHGTIMYDVEEKIIRFSSTDKDGDLVTGTCTTDGLSLTFHYTIGKFNVREVYTYVSDDMYTYKIEYDTKKEKNIRASDGVMTRIK